MTGAALGGAPGVRSAACDWFSSTMLRPGAGLEVPKATCAPRATPSSSYWGVRLDLWCACPVLGHPAKYPGPQRWCKVNFNYSPEQADELKLQAGEIVEMIKEVRGEVMGPFGER